MPLSSRFCLSVITLCICLLISSCAKDQPPGPISILPPSTNAQITFLEQELPEQCRVFAQLIISVPAGLAENELREAIEQYGRDTGADYILLGMARERSEDPETMLFRFYGPSRPYSFKKYWLGWKFGFSDWNSGGPLINFGPDNLSGNQTASEVPIDLLGVFLTCQLGPLAQ